MDYKHLGEKVLHAGKFVSLKEKKFRRHDGRILDWEVVTKQNAVVIVPFLDEKNLLMIREFAFAVGKPLVTFPAGLTTATKLKELKAEAQRELREETGCRAKSLEKLFFLHPNPFLVERSIHVFIARNLSIDPLPLEDDECIELVKMPVKDLQKKFLKDYSTDPGVLAVFWALEKKGMI